MVRKADGDSSSPAVTLVLRALDAAGEQSLAQLRDLVAGSSSSGGAATVARPQDSQQPAAAGADGQQPNHFDVKTDKGSADL